MRRFTLGFLLSLLVSSSLHAGHNELSAAEKKEGWKLLFDGTTTGGWRGFKQDSFPAKGWTVADGELRLTGGSHAGDIITMGKYSDFDLRWEWKIEPGGNNGVKYFISEKRDGAIGHEYQMIDDLAQKDAGDKHSTASFYDVLPPAKDKPLRRPGEWNQSRVLVKGTHAEHWLNGKKVLEFELGSPQVLAAVRNSKFKDVEGFGRKLKGHILLTYHNDPVCYRDIKIRDLSSDR